MGSGISITVMGQPLGDSNESLAEKPGLVIRGRARTLEDS